MRAADKWLVLVPVLMAVSCWAQDDPAQKPVCNAEKRGMTWPERISGHDHVSVELCSVKSKKYQWRPLTVDYSDLVKGAKPHPSKAPSAPLVAGPAPDAEQILSEDCLRAITPLDCPYTYKNC